MAEPSVRVSGIVLSSLMFQHVNTDSDVEGLILGESRFEEQVTISDSQAEHIHIEETYNIQKHVACRQLNRFYDGVGDVNPEALRRLLQGGEQGGVIGWYRQRRNTDQLMTFREKIVHEKLRTSMSNPHLVFLLLTPSAPASPGSTHRTEYAAFISRSRRIVKVPVQVHNLGLLEQLAYWKVSAPCSAAGYNLTMKKHGSKFFTSNGLLKEVTELTRMNESLQAELQRACGAVEESERRVEALQADVSALRRKVREKTRSEAGTEPADPPEQNRENLLLREAIRALFACSHLFHTQTLTLQAFPVPDTDDPAPAEARETPGRRRAREATPERERKRRKHKP